MAERLIAAGGGALSIVLSGTVHEQRSLCRLLLTRDAFALCARMRDGRETDNAPTSDTPGSRAPSTTERNVASPTSAYTLPGPDGSQDAAFDAFFAQHEQPLYGYLRRMLTSHDAALDVAQEAFFRTWQRFTVIRDYDRPQAWLFRVATNLALDTLRRHKLGGAAADFRGHPPNARQNMATSDGNDATLAMMDSHDMEGALAERDLVNRVLARLPERQRAAVLLWAAHGLTTAEIAAALEITEVNARQLISRGRARFRELYEQTGTEH